MYVVGKYQGFSACVCRWVFRKQFLYSRDICLRIMVSWQRSFRFSLSVLKHWCCKAQWRLPKCSLRLDFTFSWRAQFLLFVTKCRVENSCWKLWISRVYIFIIFIFILVLLNAFQKQVDKKHLHRIFYDAVVFLKAECLFWSAMQTTRYIITVSNVLLYLDGTLGYFCTLHFRIYPHRAAAEASDWIHWNTLCTLWCLVMGLELILKRHHRPA